MSHIMETGYRRTATGEIIPRDIITSFTCRYNGDGDFPRRSVSGDRGQPVHHVLHGRDRERQVRVRLDRRPRFCRNRFGFHRRRMKWTPTISAAMLLVAAAIAASRRRNPARRAPLRLQLHDAGHPGDPERRHRQSRHALGARRRNTVEEQAPALRAKACADCHDDARTSMKGVAAHYPAFDRECGVRSIWSSASICAAPGISRRRRCL